MSSEIINYFFTIQDNIKLYHWMTKSYSRHKSTDELYTSLLSLTDKFVEIYIGKYGRPELDDKFLKIKLNKIDDKQFIVYLDNIIDFMIKINNKLNKNDVDLLSIRDDIVSLLNQAKYLCTLN